MEPTLKPGHEWKDAGKVAEYVGKQLAADPDDMHTSAFRFLVGMLPFPKDANLRFVDLGAGAGAFSLALLQHFPNATGLLADFSDAMMEHGTGRLAPFEGRYRYVEFDMTSQTWPADLAGPFDVAVSSRAVHHLFDDQKEVLFRNVFQALAPGGAAANWDHIRKLDDEYRPGSSHALTESSEQTQLDILEMAGFEQVSCAYRAKMNGLFVGFKPAS